MGDSSTAVVRVGATLTQFAPECVDERDHGVAPLCLGHGCLAPILCANRDRPALVNDREIDTTVTAHHVGRELTANVKDREANFTPRALRQRVRGQLKP